MTHSITPAHPPSPCPIRVAGVAAALLFLFVVFRFWHPVYGLTAFVQLDASNDNLKIAAFREQPVFVYRDTGCYDGLYYAQIAHDPSLDSEEIRQALDNPPYRARRILLPALAWLLGAGHHAWIAQVYPFLNAACWLALALILWRLLPVNDGRGLVAWLGILFSAGALASVRLALVDLLALTLVATSLWAAERAKHRAAVGWLAVAGFARETALLAWPGLWTGPWQSPAAIGRNLLRGALAAAPLGVWLFYVHWRLGPGDSGWDNFAWPLAGLAQKCRDAFAAAAFHPDISLAWTTLLALIALAVQAVFIIRWPRPADPWWRLGAVYTLVLLCLGPGVWEGFPGAATRVLLPLNLACNVLAVRTRARFDWLVACNLTVFAGLLCLRDVPHDPLELAAARRGGVAAVLQTDGGWFNVECNSRHIWAWTESGGRVVFRTWPAQVAGTRVTITMRLRSLTSRVVTVKSAESILWQGEVGAKLQAVALPPLPLGEKPLALELFTETPGVRENASSHARLLGFALYDPVIRLEKRPPDQ